MSARLASLLLALLALVPSPARAADWLQVDIGIIGAASEDILKSALDQAKREDRPGLVIRLDTPGGALDNTRTMVQDIMAAQLPVIVWVGPAGARAGSAGAFLTISAHVAAMAPGTNIGAAHPVGGQGQDIGDDMKKKVENDTIAFIESIARTRGRNVDMARSFVQTSVSITDAEALDNDVIDYVARDVPSIFEQADGKEVELDGGRKVKLETKGAGVVVYEKSLRQKLLEILSNPNLFYLLFMAGLIGLGYELTHPGIVFPGVVGAIGLILALIAMSVLPVSYGAVALLLAGIAMMIGESFVPSFGALGVGGFIAFVLGSIFLVDPANEAGLRISWKVIAPGAVTVAVAFFGLGWLVLRARQAPVRSGREGLVGEDGVAVGDFVGGAGQIRVKGAIWAAKAPLDLRKGDAVTVTAVRGLELDVTKRA